MSYPLFACLWVLAYTAYLVWAAVVYLMIRLGQTSAWPSALRLTHERLAPWVIGCTFCMIVIVETLHWYVRGRADEEQGWLFAIHLLCAVIFLVSMLYMRMNPGTRRRAQHHAGARFLVPSFYVTAITGPILLMKLLLKVG